MFSSLEALDAEDTLNAAPVVRQGAFQPKAKPRVRKGGVAPLRKPSSLPSAPASVTVHEGPIHDADLTEAGGNPYVDVARSPIITASECQGRNSPVKVAEVSESPIEVAAEAQGAIASLEESPSTGVNGSSHALPEGDGMGSLTTGLHDAPSAFEELLASHSFKPDQSTRKKHEPRRRTHSQKDKEGAPLEPAREEQLSKQTLRQSDVLEPFTTGIQSHESEIVVPLEHTQTERLDKSHTDVNEEPLVGHGADARGVITPSSRQPVETNIEPAKKKKRGHDQTETHLENASLNADLIPAEETSKPKKTKETKKTKFANFAASVSASASQAEEIADEANGAKEITQEAVVGSAVEPLKKRKKRGSNQAMEGSNNGEKVSSNTVNATTSKETKKAKRAAIFAATAAASASQPGAEVANERNRAVVQEALVGNAVEAAKRKKRTSNQAEEKQDIVEIVSSHTLLTSSSRETNKRVRKKPAKFADGADDDFIRAITQDTSEPLEENKGHASSRANKGEGDAENDFLITFVQEKTKVKKSKLASFSATTSQPATDVAPTEKGTEKSAPPANEKGQKKKFKKCLPSRRRVERCAMNPANPDLDPKKMTMKDIIRLAEAKEKLLKNGNTKKAKDGNEATTNALEKEVETFESACLAPQVQFVDGRIVINEASLTVSAHPKDDIRTYTRVEETHSKLNYHSYMKRTPKLKWRKDETDLFYEALREFGTNFSMIQHLFPGRTRKQVLLKYKKEERSCPLRISEAMRLKPCETSHFMEVMSSMNLLPSEIPDTLEDEPGFDQFDTTFCREEIENSDCIVAGAERSVVDDTSKMEEFATQSEDGETNENNGSNPWNSEAFAVLKNDDNHSQEAPKTEETMKLSESPIQASSPPRKKKSLFSYQTAAIKS